MPAAEPTRLTKSTPKERLHLRWAALVGILSAAFFALGLGDEPFVDEYAYITQSYQPDLLFAGRIDDASWLEVLSYDLVPLPKYFINLAFRAAGTPRPSRRDALAWYEDTSYRWGSGADLFIARLPSVVLAALGCMAVFSLGTLFKDALAGGIAAFLMAANPLYRLHAHRAMSEAACEALLLLALGLGLWTWKRIVTGGRIAICLALMVAAGTLAGLSILAKFNGILAVLALCGWAALALVLPGVPLGRKLALVIGTGAAVLSAGAVFVALNPFMTAHPPEPLPESLRPTAELPTWKRFELLLDRRREVSREQQQIFSHNALHSLAEKARVIAVQGFGRFGPLGPAKSNSTIRYDSAQDRGALLWLPVVATGIGTALWLGQRQARSGAAPTAWALCVWSLLALTVVTTYLPMAWDRYQLPIQAPAALLASLPMSKVCTAGQRCLRPSRPLSRP
ncbi:MAG: ArnT family glycosyltransferase [Isosphaeraceae bacterium]